MAEDEMKSDEGVKKIAGSGFGAFPTDLVFELCLRLPIKKVHQFMCVSRAWRSIIRHPDFAKVYDSRNPPGLLVTYGINDQESCLEFHYSPLGVHKVEEFIKSPLKVTIKSSHMTEMVNGLFCSCYLHFLELCNIWTGELVRLPSPNMNFDYDRGECFTYISSLNYFFGFDPVNKLYKLLKITLLDCEILTLSSSSNFSWRNLSKPDDSYFSRYHRTMINGVMYFGCGDKLVCFNFSEEKFRSIQLPDTKMLFSLSWCWLAQFRGRLMIACINEKSLILYTLNDSEGYSWTSYATILPWFDQLHSRNCSSRAVYLGNLPTGEFLMAIYSEEYSQHSSSTSLYSYHCENNKFERYTVGKWPCSINERKQILLPNLEQNFGTLDALIPGIQSQMVGVSSCIHPDVGYLRPGGAF